MRDYYYNTGSERKPVSEMTDGELADVLHDGVCPEPPRDGFPAATAEQVLERLRIEQTIRRLGLR